MLSRCSVGVFRYFHKSWLIKDHYLISYKCYPLLFFKQMTLLYKHNFKSVLFYFITYLPCWKQYCYYTLSWYLCENTYSSDYTSTAILHDGDVQKLPTQFFWNCALIYSIRSAEKQNVLVFLLYVICTITFE